MGKNDSRTRWKRAGFLVSRIQDKNTLYARDTSLGDTRSQEDKMLETQHWLELVDAYVNTLLRLTCDHVSDSNMHFIENTDMAQIVSPRLALLSGIY